MPIVLLPDGSKVNVPETATPEQLGELERIALESRPETAGRLGLEAVKGVGRGALRAGLGVGEAVLTGPLALTLAALPLVAAARARSTFAGGQPDPKTEGPVQHPFFSAAERRLEEFLNPPPPKTTSEAFIRSISQGVGGAAIGPGAGASLLRTGIIGGVSGGSGELAERLLPGSALSRPLGELVGGFGAGLAAAPRTNAPELAREVLEKVKPADLAEGVQRMAAARATGLPLTAAQAMRAPSNIDDMIDALASSRFGDNTVDILRRQPAVLQGKADAALRALPGTAQSTQAIANRVQEATTKAIKAAQGRANAAFRARLPEGTQVNPAAVAAFDRRLAEFIEANPSTQAADMAAVVRRAIRLAPEGAPKQVPVGSGPVSSRLTTTAQRRPPEFILDAGKLKNAIDDQISEFGQSRLNDPRNARFIDRSANTIRTMFDRTVATPGTPLREARSAARQVFVDEVNPLKKSVIGRLAGLGGAIEDREAVVGRLTQLFARGTPDAKSSEILALERTLRGVDRTLFVDAVKSHLTDKLRAIGPTEGARDTVDFAAQVKRAISANPAQEQGLRDMLAGVARSAGVPEKEVVDGFMNFVKLSTAAADRPINLSGLPLEDLKQVAGNSARETALHGLFGLLAAVGKKIRMGLSEDAFRTMDRLLSTPEGIETLQKLARTPILSRKAETAITTFFASQGAPDPSTGPAPGVGTTASQGDIVTLPKQGQ